MPSIVKQVKKTCAAFRNILKCIFDEAKGNDVLECLYRIKVK
jgi:hypothetical protein